MLCQQRVSDQDCSGRTILAINCAAVPSTTTLDQGRVSWAAMQELLPSPCIMTICAIWYHFLPSDVVRRLHSVPT